MKQQEIIQNLIETIDRSVSGFNKAMPGIQQNLLDEVTLMLKGLDTDSIGNIKQSINNLKLIAKVKLKIGDLIMSDQYKKALKSFTATYNTIGALQNEYFKTLTKDYLPPKVLGELKKQSINNTLDHLTETGINYKVVNKLGDILDRNVSGGAKWSDAVKQLKQTIVNTAGAGILESHVKTITTDALNIYSAEYTKAVTEDLGLEWFMYTGSLIATSRTFCVALVKKKYVHVSELADIVAGKFEEFENLDGEINSRTGLPDGMKEETTASNFQQLRGGYGCGHQLIPVSEAVVPYDLRLGVYQGHNLAYDAQGFRTKGKGVKLPAPVKKQNAQIHDALKNYPVKLSPDIFKGPITAKLDLKNSNAVSHYNPVTNTVTIANQDRCNDSKWFQEHIIYHEVGHATHEERGIITDNHVNDEFRDLFQECKSAIKGRESAIQAKLYQALKGANADELEKISAAMDTLGALTAGKFGEGHTPQYYKSFNGKFAELFAHGSEVYHGENNFVLDSMPEVHQLLTDYMKNLYSNL